MEAERETKTTLNWDFPGGQNSAPNTEGPALIPNQGARSHMPQLRVHMLQLEILSAAK